MFSVKRDNQLGFWSLALLVGLLLADCAALRADPVTHSSRARLRVGSVTSSSTGVQVNPLALDGGSKLTLITPTTAATLADTIASSVRATHRRLCEIFGPVPPFSSTVRLMSETQFFAQTGAPKWTNALYLRQQILVPVSGNPALELESILRSVRHEYTHAVLNNLAGAQVPGWLDEGLAQWVEGEENPVLRRALRDWLKGNKPIPLTMLQGGFTQLPTRMVPAAYAQSLFATKSLIRTFGLSSLQRYLKLLRAGAPRDQAFRIGFGLEESAFEARLQVALESWLKSAR